MEFAPLQPTQLWVDAFSMRINEDHTPEEGRIRIFDVGIETGLQEGLDPQNAPVYLVTLTIETRPRDPQYPMPYAVELVTTGMFTFPVAVELATRRRMIAFNGVSILYGFARDTVLHNTALSRFGPMMLPSVNLSSIADGIIAQIESLPEPELQLAPTQSEQSASTTTPPKRQSGSRRKLQA